MQGVYKRLKHLGIPYKHCPKEVDMRIGRQKSRSITNPQKPIQFTWTYNRLTGILLFSQFNFPIYRQYVHGRIPFRFI
jgi:hypothetical protein